MNKSVKAIIAILVIIGAFFLFKWQMQKSGMWQLWFGSTPQPAAQPSGMPGGPAGRPAPAPNAPAPAAPAPAAPSTDTATTG